MFHLNIIPDSSARIHDIANEQRELLVNFILMSFVRMYYKLIHIRSLITMRTKSSTWIVFKSLTFLILILI